MSDARPLTVFYDGACPLCKREIGFYRRRKGAEALRWVDVSAAGDEVVAPGLSRNQAMVRFHVRDGSGEIISGGEAFARLWRELPGFRLLGLVFALPPLAWLLNRAYDWFLRFRPRLQRLAGARGKKNLEACEISGRCSSNTDSMRAAVPTSQEDPRKSEAAGA